MRRLAVAPTWLAVLGVGLAASIVNTVVLHGNVSDVGYDLIGAASVATILVRCRRMQAEIRRAWLLIAIGFGLWVLGDSVWSWYSVVLHREAPWPGAPDILYLIGYPVTAVGLLTLTRRRTDADPAHSIGDAAIVSMGVAVVIWQLVMDPSIDGQGYNLIETIMTVAYPAMDMMLFLLLLRVVFAGRIRSMPAALVAGSLGVTFVTDLLSSAAVLSDSVANYLNIAWLAGYVLAGAAACHPQAAARYVGVKRTDPSTRRRFLLLGSASCMSPLLIVVLTVNHHHVDIVLLCVSSMITFGLVLHRLATSMRKLREASATQQELTAALRHRADHDPLTGAVNRTAFMQYANDVLQRARRNGQLVTAAFVDLDGFKAINDGAGHLIGDELIVAVTDRLRGCLRVDDVLGRFGGDEFALLLQMSSTACLDDLGRRLVKQFQEAFTTSAGLLHIRASVGLAVAGPDDDVDTLLNAADTAMYDAKRQGKNRHAIYDAATQNSVFERLQIQEVLESALTNDRIEVHYQPIVDLGTGVWRAVEALVRCRTESGDLLLPGAFLTVAEDAGLMETIDRTVMTTSVGDLAAWRAIPGWEDLTLSINVSARALHAFDFEAFVFGTLKNADVPPGALAIELTENIHVTDPERSASLLQGLRERGVRVALDDFGTGYSGLSYLAQLPLDAIKIPMEFTRMLGDERGRDLVHTVVTMGRTISAVTVAEGIETDEQWQQLREIGCQLGQGYLFSRPKPAEGIRAELNASGRATDRPAATGRKLQAVPS